MYKTASGAKKFKNMGPADFTLNLTYFLGQNIPFPKYFQKRTVKERNINKEIMKNE